MKMQYVTHVYADKNNVSDTLLEDRTEFCRRDGARFAPSSFLSGRLDSVSTREEFLALFASAEEKGVKTLVLSTAKAPKRSKAEMVALEGVKGVGRYKMVSGALLPQEEYPAEVEEALKTFLVAV